VVDALDVDVLEPTEAQRLVQELTTIERVAAAAKALAAARVAESGLWRQSGDRSEADWLARQSGESVGTARGTLATAKKLRRCTKTSEAFRKGKLSRPQAEAIAGAADADPDAEDRLLDLASTSGLQKLRDECERVKAAKQDPTTTHERIQRSRYWRQWTDREGGRCGQ
jgi:hypothetical protein